MNRWELEKKIVMKALKDPEFKKKLLSQPKQTLKDFLKTEKDMDLYFLDKMNIKAYEEKKDEWMISIPNPGVETQHLTTADLEKLFAAGDAGCGGKESCWLVQTKG